MEHDPFRPHWQHKLCGGVVTGLGDIFKCLKCDAQGRAVGAILPLDVTNALDYFSCHPELEVEFVNPGSEGSTNIVSKQEFDVAQAVHAGKLSRWRERVRRKISM
jgi:hypothetical protein